MNNIKNTYTLLKKSVVDVFGLEKGIIYSLIFNASQDGMSGFSAPTSYLCEWTGLEEKEVLSIINELESDGIIKKEEGELKVVFN